MIRFDTKKDMEHYDNLYKQIIDKDKEIKRLQQRINKAIELLEDDYFEDGSGNNIDKVLSILRGEDNGNN